MLGRSSLPVLLVALLLLACAPHGMGQRRSETVRREQTELTRRNRQTRQRYEQNMAEVRRQLERLDRLQANIDSGTVRAARLRHRCDSLQRRHTVLADSAAVLAGLAADADSSYRRALVALRRQRLRGDSRAFVFASSGVRQAAARVRYLRQLSEWRASEYRRLRSLRDNLSQTVTSLDSATRRLDRSARALDRARMRLCADSAEVASIVQRLQNRGDDLNRELARQQQLMADLDTELNRLLDEEAAAAASGTAPEPASAPAAMPGDFARARGSLLMPVAGEATIVNNFGVHTHSQYSHVQTQNNGIDIEGAPGAPVRACFGGTVSMVIVMEGYGNVVLLRHGEYLTVYAGLDRLNVRKGQNVAAGENLGTLPASDSPRLHFEIRHEKEKLDPRPWLR